MKNPVLQMRLGYRIALLLLLAILSGGIVIWRTHHLPLSGRVLLGTLSVSALLLFRKSFRQRLFLVYLPLGVLVFWVWYQHDPEQIFVELVTLISIWLAIGAIDVAIHHEGELEKVESLIGKLESLIKGVFGLENYIEEASQIYKEQDIKRVVTSLRHWVARGDSAKWIENGVQASNAGELVFVGPIKWDVYFPGVLWRFIMLRKVLQERRNGSAPKMRILHVEPGIPVFVVSQRENPTPIDRGSLLIGNPMQTAGTNLYGLNLGPDHPKQADHYNFVFDTLICPNDEICNNWGIIQECTGIEKPYGHEDGLSKIFETKPFAKAGEIYAPEEDIPHIEVLQTALIAAKAQWIRREITNKIEQYARKEEEQGFLPSPAEIEEWAALFLTALCDQGILTAKRLNASESDAGLVGQFELCSPFTFEESLPTCEKFFQPAALASSDSLPNTSG